jgi:hypothetical protein
VLFASQTEHNPLILFHRFEVKQSAKLNLTSYSGLALIG